MKKIKLAISVLLVAALSITSIAAVDVDNMNPNTNSLYASMATPYTKTLARVMSMGGAGVAARNNQDALYINPASLGEKGLVWNVPNVSVTLYNVKGLYVDSGILDTAIDDPDKFSDTEYLIETATDAVLGNLTSPGRNKLATIDAGVGAKWGRFAWGIDAQVNLNTYKDANDGTMDLTIVPQADVAASLGVGFRLFRENSINIDIGASAALAVRGYMQGVGFQDAMNMLSEDSDIDPAAYFMSQPVALGWAVPVTAAVNVNFPLGFTISNVVSNINGSYRYTLQSGGINEIKDDVWGTISNELFGGETAFTVDSPVNWTLGLGWSPDMGWFEWITDFTVAADIVDTWGLCQSFSDSDSDFSTEFLSRFKVGAEVQLFKLLELRSGLNSGYASVGAGINLFNVIHMEAAYYWNEFGQQLGEKDVDALTIRFNIGWER